MCLSCSGNKDGQGENFLSQVDQNTNQVIDNSDQLTFFNQPRKPMTPAFTKLPSGSVKPRGWLQMIMESDLKTGVVGALGALYPGIQSDDIYSRNRRGGMEDIPEMGDLVLTGAAWEKSIMWWNSETIGNWWDGYVRHAFLTENEEAISRSHEIVEHILESQDEDGYIGIYKNNLRYQHDGSNGELWSQTTVFRMLLSYYEFTGDERVLIALEKAMAVTMRHYSEGIRNPFLLNNEFGGVTHGLMMTDVCDELFRITAKSMYRDYGVYLYQAFSSISINRAFNDMRYPFLLQKDSLFEGHGVHTYEHLRSLLQAYYATGYPELKKAFDHAMYKLEFCMLPSGAGHANEWIAHLKADPNLTATEYCAMLELRNSFIFAFQKTGLITFADRAEKLTFNAMMGARNPEGTAITYSKGDNCYVLDGNEYHGLKKQANPRFKYSPTHSDPAVCCIPNYARNYSYWMDYMWLMDGDDLVAGLYGPAELRTSIKSIPVEVISETKYPFEDQILLRINPEESVDFRLKLRKPNWTNRMTVSAAGAEIQHEDEFVVVHKNWQKGDQISIEMEYDTELKKFNDSYYLQRGPLVFAYSIPHREKTIKTYDRSGFRDYHCFPEHEIFKDLYLTKFEPAFAMAPFSAGENPWYADKTQITVSFYHPEKEKETRTTLVPMGSTILRKVTFPMKN
jgi:hypothetical protein